MTQRIYRVASALVRQADRILLVHQQSPLSGETVWSLPGGTAEPGELLIEALQREVREETGLQIAAPRQLLFTVEVDESVKEVHLWACIFAIDDWQGSLQPADPDEHILDVAFFTLPAALRLLELEPWRPKRDPLLAYLRGEVNPGAYWFYRLLAQGEVQLCAVVGGVADVNRQP